jgi:Lhr-like helicase
MNDKFKECLLEVYHAEQTGEIIFEALLKNARNEEERFIFASMLQLETEAKAIMRPTLMRLGLSIEENPYLENKESKSVKPFRKSLLKTSFLTLKILLRAFTCLNTKN